MLLSYSLIGTKIGHHINKVVSLETGTRAPYFRFSDVSGNKLIKSLNVLEIFSATTDVAITRVQYQSDAQFIIGVLRSGRLRRLQTQDDGI